jgi:DNA-binding transcriptional LysR family regulator
LSEAGWVLNSHAGQIFAELKNAELALRELNEMKSGTVRLGVGATTLTYQLPNVLGRV